MAEFRGTILAKASKTNGVKIDENWYTMDASGYCAKLEKQQKVYGTYEQTKGKKTILTIFADSGASTPQATPATETGFKCEVCGKALKDGKYKKCYDCNKSGAVAPTSQPQESNSAPVAGTASTERIASSRDDIQERIIRGNALNSATALVANQAQTPEVLAEMAINIAVTYFIPFLRG